ncbi:DDE-type integrase/transposase/recombinase [Aureimonas sp. ME7]|uniref:DDE-type integrase/transposase/recombinase n=1 Tax=Aureimonas sp. ME7 TaxID=2744252 RepID=UPI0015F53F3A|nr:DDE-type integrase/transposase/recombinase [Aureimonas sp. ME7]
MKEWLTAREIADANLPQIPTTVKGVLDLAERDGWNTDEIRSRKRAGRGGGMEYHVGALPTLAQVDYKRRFLRVGSLAMPAAANDAPSSLVRSNLSARAAIERDARLAILRAFDAFAKGQRVNKGATRDLFVKRYNAGYLAVEPWVREHVAAISVRSLARWKDEAKADTSRLAVDKAANRKGKGVFDLANDGQVRVFVLALLADNQHLSAHHIRQLCRSEFGETLIVSGRSVEMPPVRTFQHALKTLRSSEKVVLTKIQNPDLFRSTMAPTGRGALADITAANQLWMIDASPVDAQCTDGRHSIYVCIDIATRRIVLHVSKTPRASAVALMIRKGILAFGVPTAIKTDNGSDFVAKEVNRLFAHLDIEPIRSNAYSPQEKGHVERVIRTFQHDCATTLPGFVGHSVADRKAIEARKSFAARLGESEAEAFGVSLSGVELQDAVDRWVEFVYHHRPHEGLARKTPSIVGAQSRERVRTVDERALDILLLPVAGGATRTVTKHGIRVDGRHYMTPAILPGTNVLVRMDDTDLGLV